MSASYTALPAETSAGGDQSRGGISVSVVGHRTSDDAENTTYYEIRVDDRDGGKVWTTFRRFQEFWDLNETLSTSPCVKDFVKGLDFPAKKWLFKRSASVVEERLVKLNLYLRVCSGITVVATHPSFVAFIRPHGVPGDKTPASVAAASLEHSLSSGHAKVASWESEKAALEGKVAQARDSAGGADTPAVAAALWELGLAAKSHRQFEEAVAWYKAAIAIQESTLGAGHVDVARTLNSLGNCYQAMQRFENARTAYEQALTVQETANSPVLVAETLVNLGCLAEAVSDHVTAEARYRRALALQEEHLGEHHDTATTLSNIGCMYQSLRKFDDAEAVLKRSVDILQRLSRSSTDVVLLNDTATALFNLGNQYKKLKKFSDAEDCYRRAVGVLEQGYGPEAPQVARALNNLGNLLKKQEKFTEAETVYERTVAIRCKTLGDSPDTANALYNLGLLYELSGNLAAAERTFETAITMYRGLSMGQQADTAKLYKDRVHEKRRILDRPSTSLLHK